MLNSSSSSSSGFNARLNALRERNNLMNNVISELTQANKTELLRSHLISQSSQQSSSSNIFTKIAQSSSKQFQLSSSSSDKENTNTANFTTVSCFEDRLTKTEKDLIKPRYSYQADVSVLNQDNEELEEMTNQNAVLEKLCKYQETFLAQLMREGEALQQANDSWITATRESHQLLQKTSQHLEQMKKEFSKQTKQFREHILQIPQSRKNAKGDNGNSNQMDIEDANQKEREWIQRMDLLQRKKEFILQDIQKEKKNLLRIPEMMIAEETITATNVQCNEQEEDTFKGLNEEYQMSIISRLHEMSQHAERVKVVCFIAEKDNKGSRSANGYENKDKKMKLPAVAAEFKIESNTVKIENSEIQSSNKNQKYDNQGSSSSNRRPEQKNNQAQSIFKFSQVLSHMRHVQSQIRDAANCFINGINSNIVLINNSAFLHTIIPEEFIFDQLKYPFRQQNQQNDTINKNTAFKVMATVCEVFDSCQTDLITGINVTAHFNSQVSSCLKSTSDLKMFLRQAQAKQKNHTHLICQLTLIQEQTEDLNRDNKDVCDDENDQQTILSTLNIVVLAKLDRHSIDEHRREHNRTTTALRDLLHQKQLKYSTASISKLTLILYPYLRPADKTLLLLFVSNSPEDLDQSLSMLTYGSNIHLEAQE